MRSDTKSTTNGTTNGHGSHTNGHSPGAPGTGKPPAPGGKAIHVVQSATAVVTRGLTLPALTLDQLRQLLHPLLDHEQAFQELIEIDPSEDPGAKGNLSLREAQALGTVLDAADQHPDSFAVRRRDGSVEHWDTAPLRAELERFVLLRRASQSPIIAKVEVAARVVGAHLREQILPKYEAARMRASSDELLRESLVPAITHYGHPSLARQHQADKTKKAESRQSSAADRATRAAERAARAEAQAKAIEQRNQANAQLRALRKGR